MHITVCMHLLPFQFAVNKSHFLRQGDGIQMEVAVENDRAAGESSGQGASEATYKHILTCQVEVLQWSLRSHCSVEFRAEPGDAVIRSIDLTFGGSDIVRVCDGGSSVDVLNLVSGDLGENIHNHIQNRVNENLFQLFVVRPSVCHFA